MKILIKTLATGLGLGYSPLGPGTFGSTLALPLIWAVQSLTILQYLVFAFAFILFSIWVSAQAEGVFGEKDCQKIVIDEIAGMVVTFIAIPFNWMTALAGFILFRLFDITKPPPIYQSQRLKGGWGVVIDDVVAGAFANIVLQIGLSLWYMYAN